MAIDWKLLYMKDWKVGDLIFHEGYGILATLLETRPDGNIRYGLVSIRGITAVDKFTNVWISSIGWKLATELQKALV